IAEAYYLKALHLDPLHWETLENLGNLMAEQDKPEEAQRYFQKALDVTRNQPHPSPLQRRLWQFRAETVCPVIPESTEEIHQYRQKLWRCLENFLEDLKAWKEPLQPGSFTLDDLLKSGCDPSFYLGYQGNDDLAYRKKFASIFKQLLSLIQPLSHETFNLPQYPTLSDPNTTVRITGLKKIPRIGFLVSDSHEGIFIKLMGGLLQGLDPNQLEIHIIGSLSGIEKIKNRFQSYPNLSPNRYLSLFSQVDLAVEQIKHAQFDVLFYFEVGTDALNYTLPFLKLAPVQVTSWGVPITTGNPEMDYVITSSLIEAENASKHYTEALVLMPQLPIVFSKPQFEWMPKTEFIEKYQLPSGFNLISCPQNLFKLHPDFDITLARILGEAPESLLLMIEGRSPHWNVKFKKRLKKSFETQGFSHAWDRVIFLPRLNHDEFLSFLANSDLILDPFYYSGGTTSLEALSLGTPIITLPGETAKGRLTLGCYKAMNVMDCVVDTPKAYQDLALRFISDKGFQIDIREKIQLQKNQLLDNPEAIKNFQNTLIQLATQGLPQSFD
ncbi:MAG: hypothetical protein K2X66_00780, partial [Cyanobacteria bacterium]|nr:hypothetical protein [Cyanobacteriota bacterium]